MGSLQSALAAILILTLIIPGIAATESRMGSEGELPEDRQEADFEDSLPAEEDLSKGSSFINKLQRRDWCARSGDFCVTDTKLKFAECCKGLRCSCGTLWQSGKCQCKTASILGR